jgi:hypothetical protein
MTKSSSHGARTMPANRTAMAVLGRLSGARKTCSNSGSGAYSEGDSCAPTVANVSATWPSVHASGSSVVSPTSTSIVYSPERHRNASASRDVDYRGRGGKRISSACA